MYVTQKGWQFWIDSAYKMLRPRTYLMMLLFVAIGDTLGKNQNYYDPKLLLVAVLVGLLYIFGTSINDISDFEIDKINLKNNKQRLLVQKSASKKDLYIILMFCAVVCLVIGLFLGKFHFYLVIASLLAFYFYSMPPIRISYRGILAPLLLSFGYVVIPFSLAYFIHQNNLSDTAKIIIVSMYVSFIGRIILKDYRDVKGDKKFGKRTFLVRHGKLTTNLVASSAWLIGNFLISIYYFEQNVLVVILVQPFIFAILWCLYWLSYENSLSRQITYVSAVGRFGNGIALLLLTELSMTFIDYSNTIKNLLLVSVGIFSFYIGYEIYKLLESTK